jgi:hypothetical protein
MNQKPANMGIAGVEPHQLAPTVGTTGSGSTDSLAPSLTIDNLTASTRFDSPTSAMAVDSASPLDVDPVINFDTNDKIDIDFAIDTDVGIAVLAVIDTSAKIDINSAIDTAVGIAAPNVISTTSPEPEVDITGSTTIDTASPSATDLISAAIIIDPTSGMARAVLATTGGFDMAFGLFNFNMDNDGVAELISVSDSIPSTTAPSTSPVTKGNPSVTVPLAPLEEEPRPKVLTPSVGSNDFEAPPPSPTTAYCIDCNA